MTSEGRPSKWGHVLDDAEITLMLEPIPGTQAIYEYINDCSQPGVMKKVYPPNTSLILNIACQKYVTVLGEISKLVVLQNKGSLELGAWGEVDLVTTEEVVIKSNQGSIYTYYSLNSVEVQQNDWLISFIGRIHEHVDMKSNGPESFVEFF